MEFETIKNAIETHDEMSIWQHYMFVYCYENDIQVDTANWDELIILLYNIAKNTYDDFTMSLEEFDLKIGEYLA